MGESDWIFTPNKLYLILETQTNVQNFIKVKDCSRRSAYRQSGSVTQGIQ